MGKLSQPGDRARKLTERSEAIWVGVLDSEANMTAWVNRGGTIPSATSGRMRAAAIADLPGPRRPRPPPADGARRTPRRVPDYASAGTTRSSARRCPHWRSSGGIPRDLGARYAPGTVPGRAGRPCAAQLVRALVARALLTSSHRRTPGAWLIPIRTHWLRLLLKQPLKAGRSAVAARNRSGNLQGSCWARPCPLRRPLPPRSTCPPARRARRSRTGGEGP